MCLEIPWKYLWGSYSLLFLCVCVYSETSFLSHNLAKPTTLATMKELEMHLLEITI